ncbi:hypothetical protein GT755_01890 [Herbidospora sp. NEAU-GS84]|uniref:HNH nuclease domain-containing protein n=1 Tax=Herbidospora solisilvae TaxID=2696284 RepID=A0A7C9N523_9ACTN|nr:HNH endonuclease [Herbidospora solisilvae]NAS20433.1 hypothetical protein [Herbidospora solisilvae]
MSAARRRNIAPATRDALFMAAGMQCAMCQRSLRIQDPDLPDPQQNSNSSMHIAEMAHIVPSSETGPRSGGIRPGDVDGVDNLILLCPSDHTLIDKEPLGPKLWPVRRLLDLKAEHEAWIAVQRTRPVFGPAGSDPMPPIIKPGQTIEAGEGRYRTADGHESVPWWSADRTAVRYETYAHDEQSGDLVWLRGVVNRGGSPEGARWRAALADEVDLLAGGLPGLPRPVAVGMSPNAAVLVTGPSSLTSVEAYFAGRGRTPEGVHALLAGLGGLCAALGELHAVGGHGRLSSASILVGEHGRWQLRDIGDAILCPGVPADDVRDLAEIVHRLVTGRPSLPFVAASTLNPAVPRAVSEMLARAVVDRPRDRPDIREFGAGMRS